jgi:hypothetical protein
MMVTSFPSETALRYHRAVEPTVAGVFNLELSAMGSSDWCTTRAPACLP